MQWSKAFLSDVIRKDVVLSLSTLIHVYILLKKRYIRFSWDSWFTEPKILPCMAHYTLRNVLRHPVEHWSIELFSFSCVSCRVSHPWKYSSKDTSSCLHVWPFSPSRHTLLFTLERDKQPTCGISFRGLLGPKKWLVFDLQMTSWSKCIGS